MLYDLSTTPSIIGSLVRELRDVKLQNSRERFRANLERIGEIAAYEISKQLGFQEVEVETPLGKSKCRVLSEQPIVATILRAGLPLYNGVIRTFADADSAFISAYRKHAADGSFEIKLDYVSCPALDNRILILTDPMLATGSSIVATAREMLAYGKPKELHMVCALASKQGIANLQESIPDIKIWAAAIDPELDSRGYIVPGLGDAGDLAFGEKVQS